ncbi:hypothetical protein [Leadbettera azotonutricia]|uniref:Putative membrane protein n=1 Tax=Leadbettera azotonutricia (strain ATCC BAA-888 / DSM 13862 / ZAS-9) TaxID=545695 RepID=F5YDR3_LEAAZ|nr:hypothetical protein [Leadbettera azotonutricia]AEF83188.1 putative membrane protein [Leadbettera azotonutricia ZAS-9]
MKNLAKLALFFSVSFVIAFLCFALLYFLALWIDAARMVSVDVEQSANLVTALGRALPAALYITILLALSYTARRKMPIPLSIIAIIVLSAIFTFGFSLGTRQIEGLNFALKSGASVRGRPGLILSRQNNAMVLLKESGNALGPRVVSLPGRQLFYQEVPMGPNNAALALPAMPFRDETPWFIRSMLIDFTLTAREFDDTFREGIIPFSIYAGALVFLLASLRFLLEASSWPLANLFLGALAFRGVLALDTFLGAKEINTLLVSFIGKRLPPSFITPLAFCALGILVILYTLLVHLARGRGAEDA